MMMTSVKSVTNPINPSVFVVLLLFSCYNYFHYERLTKRRESCKKFVVNIIVVKQEKGIQYKTHVIWTVLFPSFDQKRRRRGR